VKTATLAVVAGVAGMAFGLVCAQIVNKYGHRLGVWADVLGVSAILVGTATWFWIVGLV
jgi:hypothetical protein